MSAIPGRPLTARSGILPAGLLLLLLGAAVAVFVARRPGEHAVLQSLADEVVHSFLAERANDPGLFPRDPWVDAAEAIFPPAYYQVLRIPTALFGDPMQVYFLTSALTAAVFLAGAVLLGARWLGGPAGGLALGFLALVPTASAWVVGPSDSVPRHFLLAALPWLLLGFAAGVGGRARNAAAVGLALGLLTNLHPLTGAHYALLLGAAYLLLARGRNRWLLAAAFGAAFLAGASPYVWRFLHLPRAGAADPEVMDLRVPGMIAPEGYQVLAAWGPPALVVAVLLLARLPGLVRAREYLVLLGLAALLGVAGSFVGLLSPGLAQIQLGRFHTVFGFLALLGLAGVAAAFVRQRGPRLGAALLAGLVLLAIVPRSTWFFERAGRRLFGRPPPHVGASIVRKRLPELSRRSPEGRRAFLDLARWAREETPKEALFLVPPEEYGPFRPYALRSAVVTRKEGGYAATFLGSGGTRWVEDYRAVSGLYARSDPQEMLAFARARGADYILAELPMNDLGLPVAFRAGNLVVYRTAP